MDRKTARKYVPAGKLPSEIEQARDWRTRQDPFEEHWAEVVARLQETPELEAKTLFEELCTEPGRYKAGQLRTLQRRVRQWRAEHGPEKRGVLRAGAPARGGGADGLHLGDRAGGDDRRPGVRAPAVRARAAVLELAVGDGVPVGVDGGAASAACSGRCSSSGEVPRYHQTDNSTAATHRMTGADARERAAFNAEYLALMRHLG